MMIDALKTKFTKVPESLSFKKFLGSANIAVREYSVISRLLELTQDNIKLSLSDAEVKALEESGLITNEPESREIKVSDFLNSIAPAKWPDVVEIIKKNNRENSKMFSNWIDIATIRVEKRRLNFRDVDNEECANAISEFIDIINGIEDDEDRDQQVQYIDCLLQVIINGGNINKGFDANFNHDRIPRYIARYHFKDTTAEFWSVQNLNRDDVERFLDQNNTNFSVISDYIRKMLNNPADTSSQWYRIWGFLDILRFLRNGVDHYKQYITEDNERAVAACFILYTFVGIHYALKKNLLSYKDLGETMTIPKTKTLSVYYSDQVSEEVPEKDRASVEAILPHIKLFKKVNEDIPIQGDSKTGCTEFILEEGAEYCLRFGDNDPVDVPSNKIWSSPGSRPVVIWNGVRPYFFSDLSTVNAELEPYIEAAHKAELEKNTKATTELNGTVSVLNSIVSQLSKDINTNSETIRNLNSSIIRINNYIKTLHNDLEAIKGLSEQQVGLTQKLVESENERSNKEAEKEANKKAEEDAKRKAEEEAREKNEKQRFNKLRYVIWMVAPVCLIWLLYNVWGTEHNLTYLVNNWLYFVFPILSVVAALGSIWIHKKYSKYSKKKQKIFDASLVLFSALFSIGAFLTNKDAGRFIADYDFMQNDSVYNQKVATYMERYVVSHSEADEIARIRLADYYMAIGDGTNALRITEPMNNVKRYKEGCAYAADALYRFQESRSVVWRIIEQYKEVYHDIPPVALQYLEGIMLFKGEGNESKIKEGFDIMMRLAESGNAKAQYDVGYYLCNIRVNKHNQFALVHVSEGGDLVAAAEYLRMAAAILPEAAVELGTLYADLTVEDSAMKYLNRVTDGFYTNASDSLISEAFYQKALFYLTTPGNDSIGRGVLKEATNRKYPKALLYEAYLNDDPKRAIDICEKEVGNHKVDNYRCYIDPIVFDYLAVGEDKKAFDKLIASRPAGAFNNDFVLGMKFFMQAERDRKAGLDQQVVADSAMAMKYMRRSANGNNGCLYAKMICYYYDAKASLQQGKSPQTEIYELHRIASEIPFAYVLEGYLRTLSDNGRDYEPIENAAIRAMGEKHPVGAYLLTFMPEGYVKKISKLINGTIDNDQELGEKSIMMQAGLRQTNRALKPYLLYTAYCLDRQCDVKIHSINFVDRKYEYHNIAKLHFWSDVAVANHAYYLETQLLPLAHRYKDEIYSRKLIEAALKDFPGAPCDTIRKGSKSSIVYVDFPDAPWIIYSLRTLTSFLQVMPADYLKAIKQRYGSDESKKVFFAPGLVKDVFSTDFNNICLPLLGKLSMLGLDLEDTGLHLLNEFSDIGRHSYKIEFEFESE